MMPRCRQASASASLRCKRREHGGRPNGEVAQASRGENGIADGGRDDRRARLAQSDRSLHAVDELDVERWHVADAQRRVAVEIRSQGGQEATAARAEKEAIRPAAKFSPLCTDF